jgi:hypothetical protein
MLLGLPTIQSKRPVLDTFHHSGATWTLVDWDDNVEIYKEHSAGHGTEMRLVSIKARNGYTQTMGEY